MATSKALKLVSTCVCPVAGTAVITTQVPAVRTAVHRATAPAPKKIRPRAYALPKTRVRVPDATPIQLTSAANGPCAPTLVNFTPLMPNVTTAGEEPGGGNIVPGGLPTNGGGIVAYNPPGGGGGGGGDHPGLPVPELPAWTQVMVGFALIGGVQVAQRRHRRKADASA